MAGAKGMTMRAGMRQRPTNIPRRPWRMLAISLVLALLFGLAEMGQPLEDVLRVARNKAAPVAASGDIVVVTIDDASQRAVGSWPWPRSTHGAMIKRLTDAGAAKIVVDVNFQYSTDKSADRA